MSSETKNKHEQGQVIDFNKNPEFIYNYFLDKVAEGKRKEIADKYLKLWEGFGKPRINNCGEYLYFEKWIGIVRYRLYRSGEIRKCLCYFIFPNHWFCGGCETGDNPKKG